MKPLEESSMPNAINHIIARYTLHKSLMRRYISKAFASYTYERSFTGAKDAFQPHNSCRLTGPDRVRASNRYRYENMTLLKGFWNDTFQREVPTSTLKCIIKSRTKFAGYLNKCRQPINVPQNLPSLWHVLNESSHIALRHSPKTASVLGLGE